MAPVTGTHRVERILETEGRKYHEAENSNRIVTRSAFRCILGQNECIICSQVKDSSAMIVTSMEAVEDGSFGGEVLYGTLQNGTLSAGGLSDLVSADVQEKYLGYIDEMIKRAFLLDAEHRQEDHRLRFQVIQVATDGADSAGQSKG